MRSHCNAIGIGSGSTGGVYMVGDSVVKNATCRRKPTIEGEIYERYRGKPWIANGRQRGDKIWLEYFPTVIYWHDIPYWRRWVVRDYVTRHVATIVSGMAELSRDGIIYNDTIHCGVRRNGELAMFDFSASRYSDEQTATTRNSKVLNDFLADFTYRPGVVSATA